MGLYSGLSRPGSVSGNFLGALGHDILGFSGVLWLLSGVSFLSLPLGGLARSKEDEVRAAPQRQDVQTSAPFRILLGGFAVGFVGQGAILSTLWLHSASRWVAESCWGRCNWRCNADRGSHVDALDFRSLRAALGWID